MKDEVRSLHQLLNSDRRFPLEAYVFVREALSYASDVLNLGSDSLHADPEPCLELDAIQQELQPIAERHLTGQELCEAIRHYAVNQFGYMSRVVLKNWGITRTSDFGDIVYNMIDVGLMKKSPRDCRTHFDDVYDFDEVFDKKFEMKLSGS